jgi:hypothetical protein
MMEWKPYESWKKSSKVYLGFYNLKIRVLQQLISLASSLDGLLETVEFDLWTYIWGSFFFSSAKAYKHLVGHRTVHPAFKWLWKSVCQNKHKVFFWLLLNDRLSTRDILQRKGICCQVETVKTLPHLFITCPFALACWSTIHMQVLHDDPFATLESFRLQLQVPFFMHVIITMSWCIWMQRNNLIFQGA